MVLPLLVVLAVGQQTTTQVVSTTTPVALRTTAERVNTPPKLSDYTEGGSRPGTHVEGFKQRDPKDLAPATEQTDAYVSYDSTNLYVAFVCTMSNPATLRARMNKREDIFADDFTAVFVDTFHDKQRAYEFFTTPRGIQADAIAAGGDDFSFDTQWTSDGAVTPTGYVTFFAIPFKVLRFPVTPDGNQSWGFALMRGMTEKDEQDFWPGISNNRVGFVSQFGVVDGIQDVSPGRNAQIIPYATFTGARVLNSAPPGYDTSTEGRAGLDTKFVAHDALTFDLTLNPDFSQIESDDPQVTVNQRFEVFFPEKRPFFIENSDIFNDYPQTLFFSRRIGDPQYGGRMTGKVGHWALGAVAIDDRHPGSVIDAGQPGFDERAYNGVFRARYDFANESRLGFFSTSRSFGSSSNVVGAVDTRLKLNQRWSADGSVAFEANTDLAGVHTTGTTSVFDISRSGRGFGYNFTYADASPAFHTDLGFIPRVDYRQATNYLQIRWYLKSGPLIDLGPNSFVQATTNWAGRLTDWIVRIPFQFDFKGRTNLFMRHAFITETVSGVRLNEREDLIQFNSDYLRWLGGALTFAHGTRPNYSPAEGLLPFLGTFTDVAASLTLRPISPLQISETYFFSRLDARADSPGTGTIFTNPIHRLRVNYQFSREWSLRAIFDANQVFPNSDLVALDRSRHFGLDLLMTWLLRPGTALYLGYSDGYDNVRLDPILGVEPTANLLSSTGRQIFIKLSYLLRF